MLRTLFLAGLLFAVVGCGGGTDPLNPPDAPPIPPGRKAGAPALPPGPGAPVTPVPAR